MELVKNIQNNKTLKQMFVYLYVYVWSLCISTVFNQFHSNFLFILYFFLFIPFQVIAAEGEHQASRALKEAADVINESPSALQLRYLQTLSTISAEKNSTIVFPLPIDMLQQFLR